VVERSCLVAVDDQGALLAAALLHRFGTGDEVGVDFRGAGDIRWLLSAPDSGKQAARDLMRECLDTFDDWGVAARHADGGLPAPACYGVPDVWPHIRDLYLKTGFQAQREETVVVARCADLTRPLPGGWRVQRSVGVLGTRFDLTDGQGVLGSIEVCQIDAEMARNQGGTRWADVGNFEIGTTTPTEVAAALYSTAATWLLLGGVEMLLDYHSEEDPDEHLEMFLGNGFEILVRNLRGWRME
jgi:hypothetical protein